MKMKTMKIIAMLLLAVMIITLGMPAMTVRADYPGTDETGEIKITKYVSSSGSTWGDYDANDSYTQETGETTVEPLGGVTFSIKKIGTVRQQATSGTVQLVYEIDPTVLAKLQEKITITSPCSSTTLDTAFQALGKNNAQLLAEAIIGLGDAKSGITDNNGEVTFSTLEQGLYLVVETDAPADVTSKSVPFFVSIPSYYTEGTTSDWTLNVNAYPKNTVGTASIDKTFDDGTNYAYAYIDNIINDTINYKIVTTVPVPDGGLKQLYIEDTLSSGLTYDGDSSLVVMRTDTDPDIELALNTDYTVTTEDKDGETVLKINFTNTFFNKLNTETQIAFEIKYNCSLNENAVLGQSGNKNSADLYYSNNNENITKVEDSLDPVVYTYGIQITKQGESEDVKLSGVEFTLTYTNDKGEEVSFTDVTGDGNNTTLGVLSFRGLEPGTYTLTEMKTKEGYILLKDPITIVISPNDETTDVGDATATVGGEVVTMDAENGSATALVPITVVNEQGFDLPTTGASGTAIFAFVGIILVIVAGVLLIIRKKQ